VLLSFCFHHSWILDNPPLPMPLDNYLNTTPTLYRLQHDVTDESTSNPTQLSSRNAMELLIYYLLRQTHRTIVGHHDEVYVAGKGGDYVDDDNDEEASSPTGGIGVERS